MQTMPDSRPVADSRCALRTGAAISGIAIAAAISVAMIGGYLSASVALAGPPPVAGGAAVARPAGDNASRTPAHTVAAVASALQETGAGGEQIFSAADLAPPRQPQAQRHAAVPAQLQARTLDPGYPRRDAASRH
jgi:hypothetical protein